MEIERSISSRSLQFYVIARHWASDLEFYNIESAFFQRLLDDYFIRLSDREHVDQLKQLSKNLYQLKHNQAETQELLTAQIQTLELMAEGVIPEDTEELAVTQIELENKIKDLVKEYRDVKTQLFTLVSNFVKEAKLTEE